MIITESEKKHILSLYKLLNEDLRPLEKLRECKISSDGKYVVYDNNVYLASTGELAPINEDWSLSDILHTGADLASMGLDFVVPGSGAVIDVINAISYIIEAQFAEGEKKDSLYLMAAITFGFVVLPGPLQAVAPALKRAVKTGVGFASKPVVLGLSIIKKSLDVILVKIPELASNALKSKLGQSLTGKYGNKIKGFLDNFTVRIKTLLSKLSVDGASAAGKAGVAAGKAGVLKGLQTLAKYQPKFIKTFVANLPKINKGVLFMKKMGFAVGKSYRYVNPAGKISTATIKNITENSVEVSFKSGKKIVTASVPISSFASRAIGAPWLRRGGSATVPFFIKRFADLLTDSGSIDETKLAALPDLDPNVTSKDSLDYFLEEEVSPYQGDNQNYSVENNAKLFQTALKALKYDLGTTGPNKDGVDGKFGPKTQAALKDFQMRQGLYSSSGKMDRLTAQELAAKLPENLSKLKKDLSDL
jgi:hypothetical protein